MKNTITPPQLQNEIVARARQITLVNEAWRWEIEMLVGIMANQMEALCFSADPDAACIAAQTKYIASILLNKLDTADFATIEYVANKAREI